jgi:hypothetical protein
MGNGGGRWCPFLHGWISWLTLYESGIVFCILCFFTAYSFCLSRGGDGTERLSGSGDGTERLEVGTLIVKFSFVDVVAAQSRVQVQVFVHGQ